MNLKQNLSQIQTDNENWLVVWHLCHNVSIVRKELPIQRGSKLSSVAKVEKLWSAQLSILDHKK